MQPNNTSIEPPTDPAALAFDQLRREVGYMRIGIEHLVDGRGKIEIPDYTDTLAAIRAENRLLGAQYKKLCDAPALAVTPDQLATQIITASEKVRAAERQSLQSAEATFVSMCRELTGFVESARAADRQNKWIMGMLLLGIASGMAVMWLFMR